MALFASGSMKDKDSATFDLAKLQFIVSEKCPTSAENKAIAQAEIEKRIEGMEQAQYEAEFNQDVSYSSPTVPTGGQPIKRTPSPGAIRKEHPKLESRFLIEFVSKVLDTSERAVRERMVRRNLPFTKEGYSKLLAEHLRRKKKKTLQSNTDVL